MLSRLAKLGIIISIIVVGLYSVEPTFASDDSFVTIVNPVRGKEFWGISDQTPLTAVEAQKEILEKYDFSATWLLRPDASFDPEMADYFKNFPQNHELGIFLEVTPIWADKAEVDYHFGVLWHYANSIFLSGYSPEERQKLVDTAFSKFQEVFGFYPKSVGAWHIDAGSLEYMQQKYGIESALICADQFITDDYQIWGSWWGVPYYPSRHNVLVPAQTKKNKLDLIIFQWAARDPVNGYGGGVYESTFSVQANDYLKHGLETAYFSKLVDVYTKSKDAPFGQITVGLENDNLWQAVGKEYENQIRVLADKKLKIATMTEFSSWYKNKFPGFSPPHRIESDDPLGSEKETIWLMSLNGRIGFLKEGSETIIRDWRLYNENWAEPYLETANPNIDLALSLPAKIDTVRFPEKVQSTTEELKEENFFKERLNLPFQTPWYVFWLVILIFVIGIIIALKLNKILALLVGLGSLAQSLTMVKSGILYRFGIGFWGPNGHDGIWHLALINELTKHFPPRNPVFSHFNLLNYHYLFDLVVALINKTTHLPVVNLYFQIFPVLISLSLGILTYLFVKRWTKSELTSFLAVFFAYFGGSFGWVVTLLRSQGLGGESMFWANQAASFLINPPFALSIVFILLGFHLYLDYQKKSDAKPFLILALIFGLLVGIKAYAGTIILFGLAMASVWEWWKKKKFVTGKLFFSSLAVSLIVFLPTNRTASSLFVLAPLWFPHTMLAFSDRLGWIRLDQARQAYLATGKWWRWILAEGLALAIFFVGNLGTRIIGVGKVFSWLKNFKKIDSFRIFFLSCLTASAMIPLLLIQKGNPWNSIQFFYYFLFLMGILAVLWLGEFLGKKRKIIQIAAVGILVSLTIPTTIGTMKHYLPYRAPARISFDELEALEFLTNQPEGAVLTYPHDYKLKAKFEPPKPLYVYETNAYVSAFSNKTTFLEDEMNLEIMGVDWRPRREMVEEFFEITNQAWAKKFLKENEISYIYLVKGQELKIEAEDFGLEKIFENGGVRIYDVRDKIN